MLIVDQSNSPIRMLRDDDYTVFVATALMQKNTYNTYDSWFDVGVMTWDNAFYTVATKNSIQELPDLDTSPNRLYTQIIYLNQEGVHYVREVYDMLGVLGDLGGIFEVTMIVFGFFLFPVSQHSFILKAAGLLYYARTKD